MSTPQEADPPDLGLLLGVTSLAIRDVLDEVERLMSEDLVLRLFALRSVIQRYQETHHI
jgi:hypothetical protein